MRLGGDRIAHHVVGDGLPIWVLTPGSFGHLDTAWEDPASALFLHTLASFSWLPSTAPAGPDEILASGAVRDLVVGSNTVLENRGMRPLKGVEGTWRPFAIRATG